MLKELQVQDMQDIIGGNDLARLIHHAFVDNDGRIVCGTYPVKPKPWPVPRYRTPSRPKL